MFRLENYVQDSSYVCNIARPEDAQISKILLITEHLDPGYSP